jgi:hypothetical protein
MKENIIIINIPIKNLNYDQANISFQNMNVRTETTQGETAQ